MTTLDIANKSTDALARLLSTENITIVRRNMKTASFDIKNRVLRLPVWKDMSAEVEHMLVLHEIGHALYTNVEDYSVVFDKDNIFSHYANVIEDARIEKKVKERYPGSRKTFINGYEHLMDKDFFGLGSKNIDSLNFIDRINLHFKLGFKAKIPFNKQELEYVQKVDRCDTIKDVISVSEEILKFVKEQKQNKSSYFDSLQAEDLFFEEEEDLEDIYEDINEDILEETEEIEVEEEKEDLDIKSSTYDALNENLQIVADEDLVVAYYEPKFAYHYVGKQIFVSYKDVMSLIESDPNMETRVSDLSCNKEHSAFHRFSMKTVSYLIKEFEMKKSADSYKRQRISKTGELDSNKLFSYKIKDDIFKNITKLQDSQKHGMIFLLDWSGSMTDYMKETVEQVINLAMFCHSARIKYQVFAFTDSYRKIAASNEFITNENGIGNDRDLSLLELFSDKMSKTEFSNMCKYLYCSPWSSTKGLGLGGTPLNESLVAMVDYIGEFIKKNQTQKNSLILLTDGAGNRLASVPNNKIKTGKSWDYNFTKVITKTSYLFDPITKKQYMLHDDEENQTNCLLRLLKDRYQLKNIRFFITYPSIRNITGFVKDNFNSENRKYHEIKEIALHISKTMRKEDYYSISNRLDVDEMYIISSKIKTSSNLDFEVDQKMNARQLSKSLSSALNISRSTRLVLSKFTTQIA